MIRGLSGSFPAEDHHAEEHQRPRDQLEQGQQVEGTDTGSEFHDAAMVATQRESRK